MFLFSETSQNPPDFDAVEKFDADYDDEENEAKISQLLKRSYTRDRQAKDAKNTWKKYLAALEGEDFYGLVMVDQAGVPDNRPLTLMCYEGQIFAFKYFVGFLCGITLQDSSRGNTHPVDIKLRHIPASTRIWH